MDEEQFDKLVATITENTRFLTILASLLSTVEKRLATIEGNVHGLYRHSKAAVQPPISGLGDDETPMPQPGEIAKSLPRRWCNTVRAWEALWDQAVGAIPFEIDELYKPAVLDVVAERTSRRLKPQTLARMMLALSRAGAAVHPDGRRGVWKLVHPTDALREKVEREANRMNAHRPAEKEAARA